MVLPTELGEEEVERRADAPSALLLLLGGGGREARKKSVADMGWSGERRGGDRTTHPLLTMLLIL